MRGKVWLAVILLALIVGLGAGEQIYVNRTFDKAIAKADEITALIEAENYAGANAAADAFSRLVEGRARYSGIPMPE